jgi:hypothetical protein
MAFCKKGSAAPPPPRTLFEKIWMPMSSIARTTAPA